MNNNAAKTALDGLKSGNERYCRDQAEGKGRDSSRRKELTKGQNPDSVILTCSDSRVVPTLIFDAQLGDLFVIRVAGNIPNPSSVASIEFAIAKLGVVLVVVMGHENCGAVEAALAGVDGGKNLNHVLGFIRPAVEADGDGGINAVIRRHAQNTADALIRDSDVIRKAVEQDGVQIVTAYYQLGTGKVDFD